MTVVMIKKYDSYIYIVGQIRKVTIILPYAKSKSHPKPMAFKANIDFLDDDFELKVQSEDSQSNRILKDSNNDIRDESTKELNSPDRMNSLINIHTDQTMYRLTKFG